MEITKGVITEYKSGGNALVTENPVENPETHSSDISSDNASGDAT